MTNAWGGGYVTDIAYNPGYYREQSPTQLKLACLLAGHVWDVPDEGAHYMELGCGLGVGALVIAASNPSWRVTALDFNPAHIAAAREMAREAGVQNVTFLEADLTTFAESQEAAALPPADIVTAHGVWSWVSPIVREGIVRLLRAKLRAGGVAHFSYNALPGWQGMLAVQRTLRETGLRVARRSDRQAEAGVEVVRELLAAQAAALSMDSRITNWLVRMDKSSSAYLAHEFMNEAWSPCWHADVCRDLGAAQMDWVAAATLIENFPELTMSAEQRAIYDRFDDPMARELIKDLCLLRTLRHDVFIRGARRTGTARRDAALSDLVLALAVPPDTVKYEIDLAIGTAQFSPDFYRPVVQMLARGPARIGDLLHAPGAVAQRENPAELAGLLVGSRQAIVVARPGAPPDPVALRLNAVMAERLAVTEYLNRSGALASFALGGGHGCAITDVYLAGRIMAGETEADIASWTGALAEGLDEENQTRVAGALRSGLSGSVPLMRMLGCLPA